MIRINDSDKFERIIGDIENSAKRIDEIFQETTSNMETIDDTEIWTGLAQKEFSMKYKELSNNYGIINNSLKIYTNFLRQTVIDYKKSELQTFKNMENNNVQLDVNS